MVFNRNTPFMSWKIIFRDFLYLLSLILYISENSNPNSFLQNKKTNKEVKQCHQSIQYKQLAGILWKIKDRFLISGARVLDEELKKE